MNQIGRGGDRKSIEYYISIDMANELSMVERNKRGKQARQYFIECEKNYIKLLNHRQDGPQYIMAKAITYANNIINEQKKKSSILLQKL